MSVTIKGQRLSNTRSWEFLCSAAFGPKYREAHTADWYGTKCNIDTVLRGSHRKVEAEVKAHNKEYHQ